MSYWQIRRAVAVWGTLTVGANKTSGTILFGSAGDVNIGRGAANRLDLGTGDSLRVSTTGTLQFGSDASISRTAANQIATASGDRFIGNPISTGGGSALTANGDIGFDGSLLYYRTGGTIYSVTPGGTIAI